MNDAIKLIRNRIYDNRCPICDKPNTPTDADNKVRGYKIIEDAYIALKGEPIKVCDTHPIEGY